MTAYNIPRNLHDILTGTTHQHSITRLTPMQKYLYLGLVGLYTSLNTCKKLTGTFKSMENIHTLQQKPKLLQQLR